MGRRASPLFSYALAALALSAPCAAQEAAPPGDRWLGPDKSVHAFGAGWTAAAGYAAALELDLDPADRRLAGLGVAAAASLAKEGFDHWTQGEPFSFKDLVAGAAGAAAVLLLTAAADR